MRDFSDGRMMMRPPDLEQKLETLMSLAADDRDGLPPRLRHANDAGASPSHGDGEANGGVTSVASVATVATEITAGSVGVPIAAGETRRVTAASMS